MAASAEGGGFWTVILNFEPAFSPFSACTQTKIFSRGFPAVLIIEWDEYKGLILLTCAAATLPKGGSMVARQPKYFFPT